MIFVFGSNLAGRHGKGAAQHALRHCGAIYGKGVGFQGRSYAIPTKRANLRVLPLSEIRRYVVDFLAFAREHPELQFEVTEIGTGLAGYAHVDIAPMFIGAPKNCSFSKRWLRIIEGHESQPSCQP